MSDLVPVSGVFEQGRHLMPIRVYYEDTDAGGIVYHATYLRFAERARSEFLRLIGWDHARVLDETGLGWVVRRAEIDFRQPARLDDALIVATWVGSLKGASMQAVQSIRRDAAELVLLNLQLVLMSRSGRPARLPASLKALLAPFLEAQESTSAPCPSIP
ncbi:MAG TPA: tol-pal system-associated acyl-CoA thioesterase [Aliidongia sp.]|nr:tol-pal system-associated acyl-CoA thioesterase [Aliidongia sp.]